MAFRNYILCFALVAGTIAGPINVQDGDLKCAKTCEASLSDSAKFQYITGNTYTYTYEGTTETRLQGSSEQTTNLKIQATADIEVLSKCEFSLKLSDVSLQENGQTSPSTSEFRQKLQANPLRFAFQDGVIENICSMSGEDERVLNIKRGVLSTFQNSMSQLDKDGRYTETDVSGTCPTTYSSKSGIFGGLTITKSKDILGCTDRTGNVSALHSERYNVPSKIQNAPLLRSTHECEQDVKSGLLDKTVCTEVLMFRPFSKDGSGAVTKATQNLKYSTYKTSVSSSETAIQRRSSMLFHHLYDESIDVNAKSEVIALLQEICSEVNDGIKKSAPIAFGELISKMKRLDSDKMQQVYAAVNGERICSSLRGKQFFYDAIPMISTEASLSLATKLITDNIVQGLEADAWLTQLAFIPRPSVEMLAAVKPLLNDATYKTKALLGVSAMVHKICDNNENCQRIPEVVEFINVLTANIGSSCASTTKEQREMILITLKAFGNAGDAVSSSSVIGRCITNQDLDTETRVIALQAYRRMPCSVSREDAMRIYQNAENDSELRIHAFLAVMSCPTTDVLTKVRMMLSGEPVNQVGSFVWTYLENLKETSSPLKQELSSILDDAKLREDFNLDVRKFSRNLEKSFFSDYLNAGAQIESNLIWSQRSYIPRSAMLNVTVEMFGNSVNLVEFGGRVQGLERIVEKFFGPNGYFSKENAKELMDNKRQTVNYISQFDRVFKTPEDKITTSMYMKMFGNELMYSELNSDDWSELQGFNMLDFLIKLAQPKKIDLTKNVQFLDSSLVVPTCVGLPMNLTVNGTSSVSVDIDGNVDLRNIAASPRSFDINGHIKPSAAIVISGMMGVDAIVTKSSMKMVASMHSSTQLDGKITLKDGEIFNIELNTPQEKLEVFHVQTEFFMNGQEMTMPEAAMTYRRCSPASVTRVIGMESCVDITLPTFHQTGLPLPPFTGPMNVQVFVEKKDTHTGYAFTAKYENERQEVSGSTFTKRVVHLSFDTPGSQIDRKLLIEGVYDPAQMKASAQLMSPWKKFEWSTSLENTVTMKRAQSSFTIDSTETFTADAQLAIEEKTVKTVWTPSLTISIPNKPAMSVTGTFEAGTGATIAAVDISVKNFSRKPITLTSALTQTRGGSAYKFDFNLKSDMLTSSVSSTVTMTPGNYAGSATLEYSMQGRPVHRFTGSGKFIDESIGELTKYAFDLGLIPTEFPSLAFSINSDVQTTSNHIDANLNMVFSEEKLSFSHKTTKQGTWNALIIDSESSFTYPQKSIDISGTVHHQHNADMLKSSSSVTYAGKTVRGSVDLDKSVADKYTGAVTLAYPGRDLSFTTDVTKILDGEHTIVINGKWAEDVNSQMSITSTWKSGETQEVTSDIKIPGFPVLLKVSVKPKLMDFMGRTDVTYDGNTYTLQSQYKLEATRLTSSGLWSCHHSDMSYSVSMSNTNGRMVASSELSWAADKKVSMSAEYNNRDTGSALNRDAKLTVVSPFGTHSVSSDFDMTSTTSGRMSNELVINGVRSTMEGRYSMGSGTFKLDTPYIRYGEVKSIELEFNHDSTHVDSSLSWSPLKKIAGDVKWSANKYSVDVTTPFEISRLGGSVELPEVGSPTAKAYWNSNEATFTMTYPAADKGEFTLTYPGHTVSGTYSQIEGVNMFTGEAEFNFDDKKFWSKVTFTGTNPISVTVDVTTPLSIKKLSANFNHEGTMMNFNNQGSLTWDGKRIRTSLEFSGKKAKISVRTPWRNMLSQYQFSGQKESFTTTTLMKWADDKQVSTEFTFDMLTDKKLTFSIQSPYYDTISGSAEHTGSMTDFNNKATLTWSPTQTVTATSTFSMNNGIQLQAEINAPESKKVSLTYNHSGDFKSWTCNAELTLNNNAPVLLYSEFSLERTNGKVGIKGVPTEMFTKGELSLDYSYTTKANVLSTLTWNDDQTITAQGTLSMENGVGFTASLETPFTERYSAEMTNTMTDKSCNVRATVQWSPSAKIVSTLDISLASGFEAKVNVNTPWRQVSFSANEHGNADEFVASTTFSWETGKEISSSLEFSKLPNLRTVWTLRTPFDMVKDVSATVTQTGESMEQFYNQIEAQYNGQEVKLATTWDMRSGTSLKVISVNPWKNFNTNMKFTGTANDFSASADFTMDEKTYSTSTSFSYGETLALTFNADTVVYKPVSLSVRLGKASNTATFKWGDNKVISAEATMQLGETSVDALISFSTPFEGYESGVATVKHTGTLASFRDTVEVNFNTERAKFDAGFSSTGEFRGDVALTSPWYNANGNFQHSGSMEQFSNSADFTYSPGKTVRASSKWNMNMNGVDAELSFNAPFKTFETKYNHRVSISKEITAHAEMSMDSQQMFTSDMTFKNAPSNVNVEFSFTCPLKSFSGKYTHIGTMTTRCNSNAEFTWDTTNSMSAQWEISMINGFSTKVTVRSPWKNFSGEIDHDGSLESFTNTVSATYEAGKTVSLVTEFAMSPDFLVKSTFTSPFKNANILFRHSGDLNSFSCHLEGAYDAQPLNADLRWSMVSGYETSFEIRSPWENVKGSFKTNTDLADLSSTASFEYGSDKIDTTLTFNTNTGYTGRFNLNSPWRVMSANFDVKGELTNFETNAAVSWEAGKSITAKASYNSRTGSAELVTPWRTMSANYNSQGPWENFSSTVDLSWETGKKITLDASSDSRSGLDTKWKLATPWRTLMAELKYDMSYNINSLLSWETGKSITTEVKNSMSETSMESSIKVNSPWRNLSGSYRRDGVWTKFDSTTEFSWETGKTIKMVTSFNMVDAMSVSTTLTTPWRDMSLRFEQTGDLTKYNGMYEVSWEANKKITTSVFFDRENGWDSKIAIQSPWRNMESKAKFTGELVNFASSFDFSWETGKTMTTSATFQMNPFAATWSYKCPNHELSAEMKHTGSLMDFTNSASFSWEPTKKIEVSSTFKKATSIMGQSSIKSPFSSDFDLSFEVSEASGEMRLTNPFTEDLKVDYTYTDQYNHESKVTYGTKEYVSEVKTTWTNGMQMLMKYSSPDVRCSMDVNHVGDLQKFTNTIEAKWDESTIELKTEADIPNYTFSQTLKTPITDYETMSWSSSLALNLTSVSSKFAVSKNDAKIELDVDTNVEWKTYKSVFSSVIALKTPFVGFEDNKLSDTFEYSQRLIHYTVTGYKGSMTNSKSFEIYSMLTGAASSGVSNLNSYVKSDIYSDEQSEVTFTYSLNDGHLVSEYKSDIKFYPEMNSEIKLDLTHQRTESGLNHIGSLEVTCSRGNKKVNWNAGRNGNMCETGFTYTSDGEQMTNYSHKTTWTTEYTKMDHEMTFKAKDCEMLKDCDFKISYDFTQPKKTVSVTMFNDPTKPFDFKSEVVMGDSMSVMAELSTPFDSMKVAKTTLTVNKATQPWNIKLESTLNAHTITAEGSASYTGPGVFDISTTFTSPIPMYESLSLSVTNAKLNDQWKPHMVIQWASDKKIEMSGTFSWVNQYKASMDISTPFDSFRSLVTDVTVDYDLPSKLSTSFEFKTNQMAQKLLSQMSFDMAAKTFSFTLESPFEAVSSFVITSAVTPRLSLIVKLNHENLFTVAGNGRFESLASHDLDVTMTYPFLNEFMRFTVSNELRALMIGNHALKSHVDVEFMRGQEVSFKLDYSSTDSNTLSVSLETPFEKFEKTTYVVVYSGNSQDFTETTETEFYYGKVNTRTQFKMTDGITFHQTITGQMKNGAENFNLQKDLVFTGDASKFDIQTNIAGSFVPTIKFETAWQYDPVILSLKTTLNNYYVEYVHTGLLSDFTCTWKVQAPSTSNGWFSSESTNEWNGTWSFKNTNGYTFSTDIKCPHNNELKMSFDVNSMSGNFNSQLTMDEWTYKHGASYERSTSPFKYEGSVSYELVGERKMTSSVIVTENSLNVPITYNDKEVFAIRANVPLNADDEYTPTIEVVVEDKKFEFDGLYKNVGEGLVRDFKLHMKGPRGWQHSINFQFEFRTQSTQLVPGDMKFYLSATDSSNVEHKGIDMTATWGNDHALITFVDPQPMKFSLDFSVSTSGQTANIDVNWDTTALNKNFKLDLSNKFIASSRSLSSEIDVDVLYMGVSRGFTSVMNWQTDSFAHKLTLDYNGKEIGYDVTLTPALGSVEFITEWRNVKVTWKDVAAEKQIALYWDSSRDLTKKFVGTSRWEETDTNTYKWTTTFSHPAFVKDIVITDTMSYDTSRVYFAWKKEISFSPDTTKDICVDVILEKNLKWGVEIRQDFNKIDIKIGTEFTQSGVTGTVAYKAANGRMKNFGLTTSYDPSTMATSFELSTPIKTLKLQTAATRTAFTITATVDNTDVYTTTVTLQPEDYYLLVKLTGKQTDVEFEAKKLPGGYQVQLSKTEGARTTIEGLASVSSNDSKTVNAKLYWNPTLYSEIKNEITALRAALKDTVKQMSIATTREATRKLNSMQLGNDFDQIMPRHESELALFQNDVAAAKLMIQRGYNQDVFFMKSIDEATRGYLTMIAEELNIVSDQIVELYETVIEPRLAILGEKADQLKLDLTSQLSKLETRVLELQNTVVTKLMEHTEVISEEFGVVLTWLQTYVDQASEYFTQHPVMTTLRSIHGTVMSQFASVSDAVYNFITGIVSPQLFTDLVYNTPISVNGAVLNRMQYYYNYYDVSDNVKNFLTHARNVAAEYLNKYLTHYIDQTLNDFKWVAYDLSTGRIEIEFVLPTSLETISMMQVSNDLRQRLSTFATELFQSEFDLREVFYMYKPTYMGQILPPFDAQGIIAGQHIRTFDRRHYDFSSGTCSYLLARDFHDGNFTVFVNYDGDEQSLTVHSNGKIIDIHQDNSVKMDASKIELPVQFFDTTITRMGSKIILTSKLGVQVVCDNVNGLCTVEMSGHYFAKTGGLFGTYNYEPLDDFTTSTNTNTSSDATFTNSWTSRCTGSNTAQTFPQIEGTKEYTACAAMFKDASSPLSAGFDVVKADNAFHKCVNDMSKDVTLTATNGPCAAVMFYIAECKFAGLTLTRPAQCVSCMVGESSIQQGESVQLTQPIKSADIIFVVEEKMCNYEVDSKLPIIAKLIESSLGTKRYRDVKFGLVGFGGENVHSPSHTHTMDSKLFAARAELTLGAQNLQFASTGSNKDVFDAIDFAAQYPFRSGVNKIIVVIPCSDCSESKHSYRAISERVRSQDIVVHVINDFAYELSVAGKTPITNYLFGIDNSAVYALKDMRRLRGSSSLYSIVNKPTDQCSSLALQTRGTVFDLNMMTKMRSNIIKSFQTVFANRLAMTVGPSSCTTCTCEYSSLFMSSRSICKKC